MTIEKESDTLKQEYANLSRTLERLTKKGTRDQIEPAMNQILGRQRQIVKELEECTGVKTFYTEEEILEENKRIQEGRDALNKKIETILWEAEYERKLKSSPSKESKFKASSAPGQTTLDMTEDKSKK